jgi:hypothetical protein
MRSQHRQTLSVPSYEVRARNRQDRHGMACKGRTNYVAAYQERTRCHTQLTQSEWLKRSGKSAGRGFIKEESKKKAWGAKGIPLVSTFHQRGHGEQNRGCEHEALPPFSHFSSFSHSTIEGEGGAPRQRDPWLSSCSSSYIRSGKRQSRATITHTRNSRSFPL